MRSYSRIKDSEDVEIVGLGLQFPDGNEVLLKGKIVSLKKLGIKKLQFPDGNEVLLK